MELFYIVIVLYVLAVTSAAFESPTFSKVMNIIAFVVAAIELALLLLGARVHAA